jgi:hypothetical protein
VHWLFDTPLLAAGLFIRNAAQGMAGLDEKVKNIAK